MYLIYLFNIHFYYGLLQHIGYSPMYYTVGLCCLSILYKFSSANSKLPIHPSFTSPTLGNHRSVLCVCESAFCVVDKFVCHVLDATYKCYMVSVSSWLTLLSMIISRSMHVTTNGIIAFFFMTE